MNKLVVALVLCMVSSAFAYIDDEIPVCDLIGYQSSITNNTDAAYYIGPVPFNSSQGLLNESYVPLPDWTLTENTAYDLSLRSPGLVLTRVDPGETLVFGQLTTVSSDDGYYWQWSDGVGYCLVPEPASMSMLALGGLVVLRRRK